jgi:hypothetical protein
MTVTLPPRAARHRLAEHARTYVVVHPPTTHRPTRHRRRRTELMQITVADLTQWHGPRRAPRWKRAAKATGHGLLEAVIWLFGSDDLRPRW